ncbi:MAG: hypothetical protein D6B25_08465 [Desulfobulbaceae bacterium]|nr:MAG: hypothetical protein D6B25_08465 [Desulfobulbaceae bacterium]
MKLTYSSLVAMLLLLGTLTFYPSISSAETLKVAFAHWSPWKMITEDHIDGIDALSGMKLSLTVISAYWFQPKFQSVVRLRWRHRLMHRNVKKLNQYSLTIQSRIVLGQMITNKVINQIIDDFLSDWSLEAD